ncbi:unnamed protein product [Wuchereria bancrofti]|uniref:Uncharacterized protein n=2 Tax=Wuchereria bancrofti TaxID=6293 RepID=A0A3P7DYG6_WUCBA|nr:unnamed protein product [Wuchereria bancrofti]
MSHQVNTNKGQVLHSDPPESRTAARRHTVQGNLKKAGCLGFEPTLGHRRAFKYYCWKNGYVTGAVLRSEKQSSDGLRTEQRSGMTTLGRSNG